MNKQDFDEFLSGVADDHKQRVCEDLLNSPETVVNYQSTVGDDSLLQALQMGGDSSDSQTELKTLVDQVEKLVPRHSITADELNRFLDLPENPEELGRIGRFRIVEFLASGGMGLVFRAVDPGLDRIVCIKLLSPSLEFNAEAKSRFERESREVARLTSERIVTVLEVGRQKGLPFLVMPMLEGTSLRTMLDREGSVDTDRAIQITRQLAEGLQYAHERHLLHRDIKPDNLWITTNGDVVILDFGLARSTIEANLDEPPITRQGTVIGTPSYMSPEQVTGKELDCRSDLFSVGVVLVEMLTGESPFKKANLFSTMMSVAGEEIQLDQLEEMKHVPVALKQLNQRLIRKQPEDRFESASELIAALDRVKTDPNKPLQPKSVGGWFAGNGAKVVAAGLAGMLLSFLGLMIWFANDKGTLVVSTEDPNVEVKIANETVTIHDPVSDQDYEVRIGETPLPSGVYQLESVNGKDGLVFSSQTIAIRRGEKTIVTVELVEKNTPPAASEEPNVATKTDSNQTWADTTRSPEAYDATTRVALIEKVRELPSLSLAEVGFDPTPALHQQAIVQSPQKLEGLGAWTIERLTEDEMAFFPNCDDSLYAGVHSADGPTMSFIRIFDQQGNLKTALPIPGLPRRVLWSKHAEDLIAVSSYTGDLGSEKPNQYALTVWHISATGGRLIRSVPVSDRSFNWDSGYRLIGFVDEKLSAIRIDSGLCCPVPETAGSEYLFEDSVSPNGRYVVTYSVPTESAQLSVWDLKSGEFKLAIPFGESFMWSEDSKNLAVHIRQRLGPSEYRTDVEFWSVSKCTWVASFSQSKEHKRSNTAISPDLKTIAVKLKKGQVVLTDTATRRERSISLPGSFLDASAEFKVRWISRSELQFYSDSKAVVWTRGVSGLAGEFGDVVSTIVPDLPKAQKFNIIDFRLSSDALTVVGGKDKEKFSKDGIGKAYALTFDLVSDEIKNKVEFVAGVREKSNLGRNGGSIFAQNQTKTEMISPKGRFALKWATAKSGKSWHSSARNLQVVDLEDPERVLSVMKLEWIGETAWNRDETLLIVRGRERFRLGTRDICKAIDLEQWKETEVIDLPRAHVSNFIEWNGGFACQVVNVIKENPRVIRYSIGYIALQDGAEYGRIAGEFNSISFVKRDGQNLIWSGTPFNESEQLKERKSYKPPTRYSLSPRLKLTEIGAKEGAGNSWTKCYSLDEKYYAEWQTKKGKYLREFSIHENVEQAESRLVLAKAEGNEFRWHPESDSAIWVDGNKGVFFFSPEIMTEPKLLKATPTKIAPVVDGWLIAFETTIRHYGFEGECIRQLSFEVDETGNPSAPAWLYNNGAVVGKQDDLHFIYHEEGEYRTHPLKEAMNLIPDFKLPDAKPKPLKRTVLDNHTEPSRSADKR